MKTFRFITLGCKVNQYETDEMRACCLQNGLCAAKKGAPANLVVINTCTVTSTAGAKSRRAARRAVRENPDAAVIAAGCAVEADPNAFRDLDERIILLPQSRKDGFARAAGLGRLDGPPAQIRTRAFLKIQDGCDRFCSYCIVPHLRSKMWSKPIAEALREAAFLVGNGHREIVLAGVRLGLYDGGGGTDLAGLLERLDDIKGLDRIRLSSIEVLEISDRLLEAAAKSGKFCRHLHIPLQSGDDEILRAMNRPYDSTEFLDGISRIKAALPGIAVTADVIVGFPGETEGQFGNTLRVCEAAGFSKIHIFPYSPRSGTTAADMPGRPDGAALADRIARLNALEKRLAEDFRADMTGKDVEALVEKKCDPATGLPCGTSREYIKVFIENLKAEPNSLLKVRIDRVESGGVFARPTTSPAAALDGRTNDYRRENLGSD